MGYVPCAAPELERGAPSESLLQFRVGQGEQGELEGEMMDGGGTAKGNRGTALDVIWCRFPLFHLFPLRRERFSSEIKMQRVPRGGLRSLCVVLLSPLVSTHPQAGSPPVSIPSRALPEPARPSPPAFSRTVSANFAAGSRSHHRIRCTGFGEKFVLKLIFEALMRAAERRRGLRFIEFELR
jgi:hypothetical protein